MRSLSIYLIDYTYLRIQTYHKYIEAIMELSDDQTHKILEAYKRKRTKEKERYDKLKADPAFVQRNRDRARAYYVANKDKKQETYKMNKEIRSAKSLFHYYESGGRADEFIEKYPHKHKLILDSQDKPPS